MPDFQSYSSVFDDIWSRTWTWWKEKHFSRWYQIYNAYHQYQITYLMNLYFDIDSNFDAFLKHCELLWIFWFHGILLYGCFYFIFRHMKLWKNVIGLRRIIIELWKCVYGLFWIPKHQIKKPINSSISTYQKQLICLNVGSGIIPIYFSLK